jgi:hypothetical protein
VTGADHICPNVPPPTSCGVIELASGYQPVRRSSLEFVTIEADAAPAHTATPAQTSTSAIEVRRSAARAWLALFLNSPP